MNNLPNPRVTLSSVRSGQRFLIWLSVAMASLAATSFQARANVYATNLRLNGGTTNAPLSPGGSVLISYILNEPASLGATVDIKQGDTTVRSFVLAAGNPGTTVGSNSVSWDGSDSTGHMLSGGDYTISITTRAAGYTN